MSMSRRVLFGGWSGAVTTTAGLLGCCLWLLLVAGPAGAEDARDFVYLPVYSQPAEDLVDVVRPMVGGGSVVAHRDQLIVHGTPEEIATVSEALERLDRPPRRLMIEVRLADRSIGHGSGRHFGTSSREYRTRRDDDLVQRVQTLDGHPALIRTGQWRPVANLAGPWPGRGAVVEHGYQSSETGFYAVPRIHGEEVTVELYQQNERPLPNGNMRGASAQTVVRGWIGTWLEVGGEQRLEEAGVRHWSTEDASERRLQLRVRALD
ncbi:secretin N-terminal domain-containing protein [Rhabdochromatium marinum]|uniref:secretin N-terminal domain-containing protein n=1 Tax=Rhabdochromatium marinum TaxID=48729 RepID=UPI0019035D36|nr:secretin N-terminal domain-containing protein [Rhabdochromatium marinum]